MVSRAAVGSTEFAAERLKRAAFRGLVKFWDKVGSVQWAGFSKEELASINAPVLIALGDKDFVRVEHALEAYELIPNAELAVIPDAGHFLLFSEQERLIPVVKHFLEKPENRLRVPTAGAGYQPGETR